MLWLRRTIFAYVPNAHWLNWWYHNPYVGLWLKSTPVKVMMGGSWHAWKLCYAPHSFTSEQLSSPLCHNSAILWGTVQWMRSDHRRCSLADNSWWLWVVFRVGSKQKILITFIFRAYTMNWSRAFSLPLNEAALCLEIASFNCLYQLQMTQHGASLSSTI